VATAAALYVTEQANSRRLKPAPTDFGLQLEGWLDLVGWPMVDTLSMKWSHVDHRSGIDQGKPASHIPTS